MIDSSRGPVVVDTGVFGARLTRTRQDLAFRYRMLLNERPAVISYVTLAELRFGAELAGWGLRRRQRLEEELARVEIVWPGPSLIDSYVTLRAGCIRAGHGLGQREHAKPTGG